LFEEGKSESYLTNFFTHFSSFVHNDISKLVAPTDCYDETKPLECNCNSDDPLCLIVPTPQNDIINSDQKCMATSRTESIDNYFNCDSSYREQVNTVTSYLDLSPIYGSNEVVVDKMRLKIYGQLDYSIIYGENGIFLPTDGKQRDRFKSGDDRSNKNLLTQTIYILWLREHNRVANELYELNPKWDDDKLFQEARKIVTAEYQHVIYNEYLPLVLGEDIMDDYDLFPQRNDFYYGYNQSVYPQAINEFATNAMYFYDTLYSDTISYIDKHDKIKERLNLAEVFKPIIEDYYENGFDDLIRGAIKETTSQNDEHYNIELFDHLNEIRVNPIEKITEVNYYYNIKGNGQVNRLSLPTMRILKGRDHGFKSYNQYREECDLEFINDFNDFENIKYETVKKLQRVYSHPDDIDLFTGGMVEDRIHDAAVGRTFACKYFLFFKFLLVFSIEFNLFIFDFCY
jgi:peroxidase